ncbi:polysaccharide deacetylase family protein [Fredinandcohnia sp. 179-A 10B2 NHS]|uniref:polysaccharide deacetylase family protein n=1 Tax=Fredinandcohnia sp. 179-A 10B2 NHS TaxID=3235176 RepID=UPI00399EF134
MASEKRTKKTNYLKVVGLLSFIILLLLYSFFLLQSKFFLEADASTPAPISEEKDTLEHVIDDILKPDQQEKESPESKQEQTPAEEKLEPIKEVDKPIEPSVEEPEQQTPIETPAAPERAVYLTFDDGPHKVSLDILALLDKYNAKATFFMLDNNIKAYPDAVKQMVEKGHSVGLHGVSHDKQKFYQSSNSVLGEMNQTQQTILDITGIETDLIRTPFGSSPHMTDAYKDAVAAQGYKLWDWNIDSRDWQFRDGRYVDSVIDQLNKLNRINEPIVILLHERPETLEHLPRLLDYLSKQNYEFKALDSSMHPIQLY